MVTTAATTMALKIVRAKGHLKRFSNCFFILLLLFSISLTVHAHPGRTDSNGGHTNHSTGEYHYHHGQSAHQHFDIDGNGSPDCPLTFDGSPEHSQSPAVGIVAASCIGLAVTAGAISKSKEK